MRGHSANELIYTADILAADGSTVLVQAIRCGLTNFKGRATKESQAQGAESTHVIVIRWQDSTPLVPWGFIRIYDDGIYIIDNVFDSGVPRPKTWREVHCHTERENA